MMCTGVSSGEGEKAEDIVAKETTPPPKRRKEEGKDVKMEEEPVEETDRVVILTTKLTVPVNKHREKEVNLKKTKAEAKEGDKDAKMESVVVADISHPSHSTVCGEVGSCTTPIQAHHSNSSPPFGIRTV